ncbi:hypothetical protein [Duganella callida]|uniref:Uncharacterized protein n=1 Tax=Duganella callida TaxID=2561932 RepID=A0A4Y9S831_9BURK|nr:hypothetical protein [Duganella callida]TFW17650.1 hypothetical protein E4L98_20130 [Duganella callida]
MGGRKLNLYCCAYAGSSLNPELGPALSAAQSAQALKPTYWRARASELDSLETSASQMRSARKPYGAIKVVTCRRPNRRP